MCGILIFVSPNKFFDEEILKNALKRLSHRGPDALNYKIISKKDLNLKIFLGHTRLKILDLRDEANQPMCFLENCIVYNGEIHNYKNLKNYITIPILTNSDTEVLLKGLIEYGESFINKLNGMWAFGLLSKNYLLISRDRFGIKPLYIYYDKSKKIFIASSELKVFFELSNIIPITINNNSVIKFLYFGISDINRETFLKNVVQIDPGSIGKLDLRTFSLTFYKFYNLRSSIIKKKEELVNVRTEKQMIEYFKEYFLNSLRIRLISDVPLGSSLSGGLDSTAIVASILKFLFPEKYPYYSFTFDPRMEKNPEIKNVENLKANFKNLIVFKTYLEPGELRNLLWDLIYYQDEPFLSLSIAAQYKVMEKAREVGVKVLLDGQGADEILGGYSEKFIPLLLLYFIKHKNFKNICFENLMDLKILTRSIYYSIPPIYKLKLYSYNLRRYILSEKIELVKADLLKYYENMYSVISLEDIFLNEIKIRLPRLLKYVDRNSMRFGIEVRPIFLDHNLVEFSLAMPIYYKIKCKETKYILKKYIKTYISEKFIKNYRKLGFPVLQDKLLKDEKKFIYEILFENKEFLKENILIENLLKDFDILIDNEKQASTTKSILWRTFIFTLWYYKFFKR